MATYRIYRIGSGGRLQLGEGFQARNDAAAIERASELREGQPVEIWEGGRLVGRVSKHGDFTPGAG